MRSAPADLLHLAGDLRALAFNVPPDGFTLVVDVFSGEAFRGARTGQGGL